VGHNALGPTNNWPVCSLILHCGQLILRKILPIFVYGSEIWCLTSTLEKKKDALDNWCLRRILHIHWTDFVQWCGLVTYGTTAPVRYYPSTALVLLWSFSAVPTLVKTTPELSGPAFGVLPKTGDEELEARGKPGWERLRMICARSTSAWRRQDGGGALWIDRHGDYSWMRLRPRDTLQRVEREREIAASFWHDCSQVFTYATMPIHSKKWVWKYLLFSGIQQEAAQKLQALK